MLEKPTAFDLLVAQNIAMGMNAEVARIMAENALNGLTTIVNQGRWPDGRDVISIETKKGGINLDEEK